MRISLAKPFAEKEAVKALGARWDATRKVWYITEVADLTPFMWWIPYRKAATESSSAGTAELKANTLKAQSQGGHDQAVG